VSSVNPQRDYVAVTYNEKDRPFTQYPDKLARYLSSRYKLPKGSKLLDLGCGRGEFLMGFIRCGLNGYGVDQSSIAKSVCPEAEILQSDVGKEPLPYHDNSFDVVFSKSVLEHFYYPEKLVMEIYRIVKPGGLVITMVPDWESVYKTFYEDYTHRTPFTINSLRDIFLINGFDDVKVEKFRQLPFLWSLPWLQPFCSIVAFIAPRLLRPHSKLVRFSQEIMLLSSAVKPDNAIRGENEHMF
jgi:SAM-dependent methyltransferase